MSEFFNKNTGIVKLMEQLNKQWKQCLDIIQDNLNRTVFDTWFAPLVPVSFKDKELVLQVPSQFYYEYIEEKYLDLLSKVLYKVFGDSTRTKILTALFESEMCVCDIGKLLGMTKSAISHQLRILRQSKLVKARKSGKEVFYSLADKHVKIIFKMAIEHVLGTDCD